MTKWSVAQNYPESCLWRHEDTKVWIFRNGVPEQVDGRIVHLCKKDADSYEEYCSVANGSDVPLHSTMIGVLAGYAADGPRPDAVFGRTRLELLSRAVRACHEQRKIHESRMYAVDTRLQEIIWMLAQEGL